MYLEGFDKFWVIFVHNIFLGQKNHFFGNFSEIWFFAKYLTI